MHVGSKHLDMRDSLTRRTFAGVTTASLASVVSLSGCLGGGGDGDGGIPAESFSVDADMENSEITVTYDSGEMLVAENTTAIQILRETEDTEEPALLGEWKPPIEEGGSKTVQGSLEAGNTILVRWISGDEKEFKDVTTQEVG
jgi:hypothetical protein